MAESCCASTFLSGQPQRPVAGRLWLRISLSSLLRYRHTLLVAVRSISRLQILGQTLLLAVPNSHEVIHKQSTGRIYLRLLSSPKQLEYDFESLRAVRSGPIGPSSPPSSRTLGVYMTPSALPFAWFYQLASAIHTHPWTGIREARRYLKEAPRVRITAMLHT